MSWDKQAYFAAKARAEDNYVKATREVNHDQAAARARRKEANLAILRASSLPFIYRNDNDYVLMRDPRYPQIDFHSPMSKWIYNGRYVLGDAQALVEWLERKSKVWEKSKQVY